MSRIQEKIEKNGDIIIVKGGWQHDVTQGTDEERTSKGYIPGSGGEHGYARNGNGCCSTSAGGSDC